MRRSIRFDAAEARNFKGLLRLSVTTGAAHAPAQFERHAIDVKFLGVRELIPNPQTQNFADDDAIIANLFLTPHSFVL